MDDTYLEYRKRQYGQDHDFYKWSELGRGLNRPPKLVLPEGKTLAVSFIIPLEFFSLNSSDTPFKHPGSMVTPYPDLRHFTVRDYGNRVGVYRILEAFSEAGLTATFAVNAEIAKRYPPLINIVLEAGHEIAAHGVSTNNIHHEGLTQSQEVALIEESLSAFSTRPKGWLSPARNQSSRTLELLAKAGLEYCLDWEMDRQPVPVSTPSGALTLLPNQYELSDFNLLINKRQTEWDWHNQLTEAMDFLSDEAPRFGPGSLALTLTPYVMGQPFRIAQLRQLLTEIAKEPHLLIASAGEVAGIYKGPSQ